MALLEATRPAFDLRHLPPAFYENPYPTYRALREETPVCRLPDGSLFLTRYADMERVYKDTAKFSSDKKIEFKPKFGDSPLYEHHTTSLVFNDPPLHTRVRRLINNALTPRAIAALEPDLVRLVDSLIDEMEGKATVDLVEDYAISIPVEVIGNLLDVPHEERGPLRQWSLDILGALEPVVSPDAFSRGNRSVEDFCAYLETLVARRREAPGDPERDVLTRLIAGESSGERLSERELLQNCIFILNAGHETTTNLIGNGLNLLLECPDERQRLLDDPALVRTAIDEMLRFDAPVQLGNRMVTEDSEIGGVPVKAGTSINLCIGAANRDPAQFPDPDQFDVGSYRRTGTSRLSPARINASAWRSRGWKDASPISRFLERHPGFQAGRNAGSRRAGALSRLRQPVDCPLYSFACGFRDLRSEFFRAAQRPFGHGAEKHERQNEASRRGKEHAGKGRRREGPQSTAPSVWPASDAPCPPVVLNTMVPNTATISAPPI